MEGISMILRAISLFLAGLFLANGIPHFVNGISGRAFHNPTLHRFFPAVPSPLFNVIWGLLNFGLVMLFLSVPIDPERAFLALGFAFAAIGLSIFFNRPIV